MEQDCCENKIFDDITIKIHEFEDRIDIETYSKQFKAVITKITWILCQFFSYSDVPSLCITY